MRARFWARSMLGWPRFSSFAPNAAHHALKEWPQVTGLVTQNVDRLHDKAGQRGIELHGALADVVCLTCAARSSRDDLQCTLERENRHALQWQYTLFADGDADIPDALVNDFVVPECACGGTLMPDVVFFGGSVPRPRVDAAFALLDAADALLVVGSSLTVFSGYRFAVRARDRGIPIAIINLGATRADAIADVTLNVIASLALPILQQRAA
jgi:NAD-dependent SIR2 family protein deacetylase